MKRKNYTFPEYYDSPKNRKWEMTDKEILRSWRCAKDPILHVRVLAELNARSVKDVVEKLKTLGIDVSKQEIRYCQTQREKKTWTQTEIDKLIELKNTGKSWREIAFEMNRSDGACQNKYLRVVWGGYQAPCKG